MKSTLQTVGKPFLATASKRFFILCLVSFGSVSLDHAFAQPGSGRGPGGAGVGSYCPAGGANLRVSSAQTSEGAVLIFKGNAEELQAVRPRLEKMAERHSARSEARGNVGMPATGRVGVMPGNPLMMPASGARVVSAPGNLQLVFEAGEARDLGALREAVRLHALQMTDGCAVRAPKEPHF
jgi:hypothetical protein